MIGRIAALVMHLRRSVLGQFALVIAGSVALGLIVFLPEWLGGGAPCGVRAFLSAVPAFSLAGVFLLASLLLDIRAGFLKSDWPVIRTITGAICLASLFAYVQWAMYRLLDWPWIIGAGLAGAFLAWCGWRWARIVEHV